MLAIGRWRAWKINRKCLPGYGGAAIVSTVAQILVFAALSKGQVSVVIPLIKANPLLNRFVQRDLLKHLEKVTALVGAGALFVVGGVTLILYR